MAIEYRVKNDVVYAMLSKLVRIGDKVGKTPRINLGQGIAKEKGIYKNRVRGFFQYAPLTDEYSKVPPGFLESPITRKKKCRDREILEVEFESLFFI